MRNTNKIKVGEKCSTGQIVESILGQSARATVFITKDRHMRWQYHENNGNLPDSKRPALEEFDSLMAEIKSFMPVRHKNEAYTQLGKALFSNLNSRGKFSPKGFKAVHAFINRSSRQRSRFLYTVFALTTAVLVIAILAGLSVLAMPEWNIYALGAIFGAGGAAVSVMQRSKDLKLDAQLSDSSVYLQASVRILLGMVFGVVFVFASKANLVMGKFNDDIYALCIFAFVAGFSERFVPDLIERLEARPKSGA